MSNVAITWARGVRSTTERPITAAQKAVLYVLADRANGEAECWPGLATIAAEACLSERGARDALRALEAAGLLASSVGGGRNKTSTYRLQMGAVSAANTRQDLPPLPTAETRQMDAETRQMTTNTRQMTTNTRQHLPPKPHEASISQRKPKLTLVSDQTEVVSHFEDWWNFYPRKVGKDGARKAYAMAVKRGATEADLAHGLQRQKWPSETRFIPHPTTWLNQGRWQDDPEASAPADCSQPQSKLAWVLNDPIFGGR